MEPQNASGRTFGDTVVEILRSWKLIVLAFAVPLAGFLIIINDAEPGTAIEVFGIKYLRAKAKPAKASASEVGTGQYKLPLGEVVKVGREDAMPIIDGSLAIELRVAYNKTFSEGTRPGYLGGASLVGPNISKVKIAARTLDGRVASLVRPVKVDDRADFNANTYLEIEYRDQYFSLLVEADSKLSMRVTVKPIRQATLELVPVAKLPESGGGSSE